MAKDYAADAKLADALGPLLTAMAEISRIAQSGLKLLDPLSTSIQMWNKAGEAINSYTSSFTLTNNSLRSAWTSTTGDADEYFKAVESTRTSLIASHDAMTGGGPGGGIPAILESVGITIKFSADAVKMVQDRVDLAVAANNRANASHTSGGSKGGGVTYTPTAEEKADNNHATFLALKPDVVAAGGILNSLAGHLDQMGPALVEASSKLKWNGPGANPGEPGSVPGTAPGTAPGTTPGGVPGGAPTDPGAPTGQDAGAGPEPGGETPGAGGEMPGGDTGLAGMPPTAPPVMPPPVKLPTLPPTSLPHLPPPLAIPPIAPLPVRPGTGGPGIGRVGGGGPGGIGGGVGGLGKGGDLKTGNGFQQIPRAGQQVSAAPVPSGGQAPAAATGLSSGSGAGAAGGGGMPPMMPPMGGAGGGGRNGKTGAPIRPVGRRRERREEDTPGVPVGLRGRAGRDLPGAFPAVPASTRRRQDTGPSAETLQLLDEELWKVDETEVAAPPATQRFAN
ncbi:hypothetical protein ACFTSF_04205 [Kribbella sp. NPDC056951]|uniref:hypothetical protein n=1 Tax=Kribbella sp. NPDC056951 TaxID=3345978 RepID=UPI00362B2D15